MLANPAAPAIVALAESLRVSSDMLGLKPLPKSASEGQPAAVKVLWRHLKLVASLPMSDQLAVPCLIDTAAGAGRSV